MMVWCWSSSFVYDLWFTVGVKVLADSCFVHIYIMSWWYTCCEVPPLHDAHVSLCGWNFCWTGWVVVELILSGRCGRRVPCRWVACGCQPSWLGPHVGVAVGVELL